VIVNTRQAEMGGKNQLKEKQPYRCTSHAEIVKSLYKKAR